MAPVSATAMRCSRWTLLPQDTDIVVDAGNTGAAAIHWLPARRDGRFLVALGMGGMGYSFGAGIGMAFARAAPQRWSSPAMAHSSCTAWRFTPLCTTGFR